MSEQSHKREMAAAVRGDFERLRRRGVATTMGVRRAGRGPEAEPTSPEPAPIPPTSPAPALQEPAGETVDHPAVVESAVVATSEPTPVAEERRGALARLLGRR